jgi:hypothetical protein
LWPTHLWVGARIVVVPPFQGAIRRLKACTTIATFAPPLLKRWATGVMHSRHAHPAGWRRSANRIT